MRYIGPLDYGTVIKVPVAPPKAPRHRPALQKASVTHGSQSERDTRTKVFSQKVMREKLPKVTYKAMLKTIKEGAPSTSRWPTSWPTP